MRNNNQNTKWFASQARVNVNDGTVVLVVSSNKMDFLRDLEVQNIYWCFKEDRASYFIQLAWNHTQPWLNISFSDISNWSALLFLHSPFIPKLSAAIPPFQRELCVPEDLSCFNWECIEPGHSRGARIWTKQARANYLTYFSIDHVNSKKL